MYRWLRHAVKSFHKKSNACVRTDSGMNEWFECNASCYVMSPLLVDSFMNEALREMRVCGGDYRLLLKDGETEWKLQQSLYANVALLVDELEKALGRTVCGSDGVCE